MAANFPPAAHIGSAGAGGSAGARRETHYATASLTTQNRQLGQAISSPKGAEASRLARLATSLR